MHKIAIMLYGSPGSGKGTQANLIEQNFHLLHFDTGHFLEGVVHDSARQKEKTIRRERRLFDAGILMTPSFVLREVSRAVHRLAKAGWGVVFSGSPRTVYEAKGLIPQLERLYGKRNIFIFAFYVPAAVSVKRNSARLVCKVCGSPLLTAYYRAKEGSHCPVCGGALYRRSLDTARTIGVRLREYETRTKPIFELLRARGYHVTEIDGRPAPYKVFAKVHAAITHRRRN